MIDSNRVTGSVSKEKDNSGRWRVEFRVKNGKGDGRPLKSLKRGFKTKREAQAYLDELKTEWIEKSAKLNDPKHKHDFYDVLDNVKVVWYTQEDDDVMYIYQVSILINEDENLLLENKIDTLLQNELENTTGEQVSSKIIELDGTNIGKCQKCNCWCSDPRYKGFISELSSGAKINDCWLCDLCLSHDHPNAF